MTSRATRRATPVTLIREARAVPPIPVAVAAVVGRAGVIGVGLRIGVAGFTVVAVRPRRDGRADQRTCCHASGDSRTPAPSTMPAPLRGGARGCGGNSKNARKGDRGRSKLGHVVLLGDAATTGQLGRTTPRVSAVPVFPAQAGGSARADSIVTSGTDKSAVPKVPPRGANNRVRANVFG